MKRFSLHLLIALLASGAPAPSGFGSGTRIGFKDSFAAGRGNAFVATADNPSAVYYNPAGLTQLEGWRASGDIYTINLRSRYTSPAGESATLKDQTIVLPQFFLGYSAEEVPYGFGIGAYAPFGLRTEWPEGSALETLSTRARLEVETLAPVLAWRIAPGLSLGAGPAFHRVEADLRRALGFIPDGEFRFRGDGRRTGYQAGLHWQPGIRHAFGLSYHSRFTVELEGTSEARPVLAPESARTRFAFPEYIIAGYSFRPTPDWNIEVNLDWTNWDRFNTTLLHQDSGDVPLIFDWKSGFFYELGATRNLPNGWRLSAGYLHTQEAIPQESFNPAVPDSKRHFACAGIGGGANRLRWDLIVQHGFSPERDIRGSPASLIGATGDGTYRNRVTGLAFSFNYAH